MIVQALDPSARALRHAAAHDADGFVAGELERREAFGYPPYRAPGPVGVLVAWSPGPELAAAEAVRDLVAAAGVPVLGPAPLFRRRGRHRAQLVVRSPERLPAIDAVRAAVDEVAAARGHAGVAFAVDVDPQ